MTCPDCGKKMRFLGHHGTAGIGPMISECDFYICKKRHVWARLAPPVAKV